MIHFVFFVFVKLQHPPPRSHLSADRLGLQAVPAQSEVAQRGDGARPLRARREPAHKAVAQAFYLNLLLVKFPLKFLRQKRKKEMYKMEYRLE